MNNFTNDFTKLFLEKSGKTFKFAKYDQKFVINAFIYSDNSNDILKNNYNYYEDEIEIFLNRKHLYSNGPWLSRRYFKP